MEEFKQLNELITDLHNWHYTCSSTGLVNPNESPNGNQIYHLYSTGEISFQKGGWAYLQRSECISDGKITNYQTLGLKLPKQAMDGSTYAILTREECRTMREKMIELIQKQMV